MKRLNIEQDGYVRGGWVDYEINGAGSIQYAGRISVKVGIFGKTQNFSGTAPIAAELLQSSHYANAQVGDKMVFNDVEITILQLAPGQAQVAFRSLSQNVAGTGWVKTSEAVLDVISADLNVNTHGMRLSIRLR